MIYQLRRIFIATNARMNAKSCHECTNEIRKVATNARMNAKSCHECTNEIRKVATNARMNAKSCHECTNEIRKVATNARMNAKSCHECTNAIRIIFIFRLPFVLNSCIRGISPFFNSCLHSCLHFVHSWHFLLLFNSSSILAIYPV